MIMAPASVKSRLSSFKGDDNNDNQLTTEVDLDQINHLHHLRRSASYVLQDHDTSLANSPSADGDTFPEGGFKAWLVVLGSFMGWFPAVGLLNTVGVLQSYVQNHQLRTQSASEIGWIFGLLTFLALFCGVQIGPIFDSRGPRMLVLTGSILLVVTTIALSFCTEYWHFMLVLGLVGGFGTSLVFTPSIASVGHWFSDRRGLATGVAASGGSFGGIVFPLALQKLFPEVGFAWTIRILALIFLVTLTLACILIRSRLPKKPFVKENVLPDFRIFKEPKFALATAGVFFVEWGLFVPISYLPLYAQDHSVSSQFAYQLVSIFNASSSVGRLVPGMCADFCGRFNTLIITVLLCLLCNTCLWLPAGDNVSLMIAYAVLFGFSSGSNISLTPVCFGQLCKTEHYGRYYATAYTVVSFA